MKFLLLLALACLVSTAEDPLPFSRKFNTIYLAGKHKSTTAENSQMRILMREVKFFNQYRLMSMTFYVRKNGNCQLHTVWADKLDRLTCFLPRYLIRRKCTKRNGTDSITGTWVLQDAVRHFPKIYYLPAVRGGLYRIPSTIFIEIYFVSNTNILFEVEFLNDGNYYENLTGVLATGTNITKEMQEEYMKLTQQLRIPTENIENVYETDACPKWEP